MMSDLDPQDEAVSRYDSQSSDQSKSGLRQAWDAWTSKPENNAALLQFGIAMLQPRSPGQSGIGAVANAVGEGAQASERNVALQQAQQKEEAAQAIKEREAGSREVTAQAYADQVGQGGKKGKGGMQAQLMQQRAFNTWMMKPSDLTGLSEDPIFKAVQQRFPDIKTKADIINNAAARDYARGLMAVAAPEPDEEAGATSTPTPAAAAPVQGKPVYNKATGAVAGYWYPDKGFVPIAQ
jgi:hypothetical protein